MNNKTVLQEILELNEAFNTGIYFVEYYSKKRLLKLKIDYEIEVRMDKATLLVVRGYITKDEFNMYRECLENTRIKYKKLLLGNITY